MGSHYRVLRAAASFAVLAGLLVAVPFGLASQSGFLAAVPRLLSRGGGDRAWHALSSPPTSTTWHVALVVALWMVWCWFAACLSAEIAAHLRSHRGRRDGRVALHAAGRRGAGRSVAVMLVAPLFVGLAGGRHAPPSRAGSAPVVLLAADHARRGSAVPAVEAAIGATRPPSSAGPPPAGAPAPAAGGGSRWSWSTLLVGAAGALAALVVEEARRLADVREVRRLRRALAAAPVPTLEHVPAAVLAAPQMPPPPAAPIPVAGAAAGVPELPARDVTVRLLGEPLVDGAPGPFDRPKVVESLAYLALHPDGAPKQRWATALWPDRALSANSLNTAVWQLRRALGLDADGQRHLPAAHSGRLRLGPRVRTDLADLELLVEEGSPAALRLALELVRGRPFDGLGDADWVVFEGHASRAEAAIAEAALALGAATLSGGRWPDAAWAARRALLACPYDERLYRLLADAATAAGNGAAAAAAMDELRRAVGPRSAGSRTRAG